MMLALIALSTVNLGPIGQPAIASKPQLGTNEFLDSWDANQEKFSAAALSHPEIKKYTEGSLGVVPSYLPPEITADKKEKIEVEVDQNRVVTGDWRTSYQVTLTDRYQITADIVDGQIVNVVATPRPDETYTISFTESQKLLLEFALQNENAQALLHDNNWYVRHIHTTVDWPNVCPFGQCSSIVIDRIDSNESLVVTVNTEKNEVVQVQATPGW
jgi:hypothetical protein